MIPAGQLLNAAPQGESSATLDRPIDHLIACHDRILQRLDTLVRAGGALDSERRTEAIEAVRRTLAFFDSNGLWHTQDEEQSVFPRMRPLLSAEEAAYLDRLEEEHRRAEEVYSRVHALGGKLSLSTGSDEDYRIAAEELARLYRAHIASENDTLVSTARRVLDTAQLASISTEMKQRRGR